jgi:Leucine-rich repeat (LRR) protein
MQSRRPLSCVSSKRLRTVENRCPQIAQLALHLPALQELYLSDNDFSDILTVLQKPQVVEHSTSTELLLASGLDGLRVLDLSECRLTQWEQVTANRKVQLVEVLCY